MINKEELINFWKSANTEQSIDPSMFDIEDFFETYKKKFLQSSACKDKTPKVSTNKANGNVCIKGFDAKSHYCFECEKEDDCSLPD